MRGPLRLSLVSASFFASRLRISSCLAISYSSATIDERFLLLLRLDDPELLAVVAIGALDLAAPSRLVTLGGGLEAESAIMVGLGFLEEIGADSCLVPSRPDTRPLLPPAELETISGQLVVPLQLVVPAPLSLDLTPSLFLMDSFPAPELELTKVLASFFTMLLPPPPPPPPRLLLSPAPSLTLLSLAVTVMLSFWGLGLAFTGTLLEGGEDRVEG